MRHIVIAVEAVEHGRRSTAASTSSGPASERNRQAIVAGKRLRDLNTVVDSQWDGRADNAGVVEIAASLFLELRGWPDNFGLWALKRAPSLSRAALEALVDDTRNAPDSFNPWEAGKLLQMSEITRVRLNVTHLKPCDLSPVEIELSRRETKRLKDAERRKSAGATPRADSDARRRPWEALGLSRATYFRAKRNGRETVSREIYIEDNTSLELVSKRNGSGAPSARPPFPTLSADDRKFIFDQARCRALALLREATDSLLPPQRAIMPGLVSTRKFQ